MDVLTHLFLPLTVAFVLWRDEFDSPLYFTLPVFAIFPDFDKFLDMPGLLHSLLTTVPIAIVIYLLARHQNSRTYGILALFLLFSHLVLDLLDGGPVTFLYPVLEQGIGFTYPARLVLNQGPLGATVEHPLPNLRVAPTHPSREQYTPINGYGVLSALMFAVVYFGLEFDIGGDMQE